MGGRGMNGQLIYSPATHSLALLPLGDPPKLDAPVPDISQSGGRSSEKYPSPDLSRERSHRGSPPTKSARNGEHFTPQSVVSDYPNVETNMLVLVLNAITKPFHHGGTENTEEKTKHRGGK